MSDSAELSKTEDQATEEPGPSKPPPAKKQKVAAPEDEDFEDDGEQDDESTLAEADGGVGKVGICHVEAVRQKGIDRQMHP